VVAAKIRATNIRPVPQASRCIDTLESPPPAPVASRLGFVYSATRALIGDVFGLTFQTWTSAAAGALSWVHVRHGGGRRMTAIACRISDSR